MMKRVKMVRPVDEIHEDFETVNSSLIKSFLFNVDFSPKAIQVMMIILINSYISPTHKILI